MDVITGAKLQDEILTIVALSVFADKSALVMLNSSRRYVENIHYNSENNTLQLKGFIYISFDRSCVGAWRRCCHPQYSSEKQTVCK